MGRYVGPVCRLCRREGAKLFLKGDRCGMAKCPIDTGRSKPGMHGASRRQKLSDYGKQFREKQRLRRIYGLDDGQFRLFFERSRKGHGNTGEKLLQRLEMRLDNLVYRFGMAASRRAARQLVLHGHVLVLGRRVNIPSRVLRPGEFVEVAHSEQSRVLAKRSLDASESKTLVPWLAVDRANFRGEIHHLPTREEIGPEVDEQLVVELCSK